MGRELRKFVLFFLVGFYSMIFYSAAGSEARAAEKMAFVNVGKLFDSYEKTIQEDKKLAEQGAQRTKERDSLVQEIRRLKDELTLLSDESREEKQIAIDEKLRGLSEFDRNVQMELSGERKRIFQEVLKDIEAVVDEYGRQNGYEFIFHDSALLFKTEKNDVTADVLAQLNNRYRKEK